MAVLTDREIRELVEQGSLGISDFSPECLQPASYDLRLGEAVYLSSKQELVPMLERKSVTIEPGSFALVTTLDKLTLPTDVRGRVGLRSRHSLGGLINLSGPQIDPGFSGHLTLGLVNMGPRPRIIQFKERLFTVELDRLEKTPSKAYTGFFQGSDQISPQLIDALSSDKPQSIAALAARLEALEGASKTHSTMITVLLVPIVIAFAMAVLPIVLSLINK